MTETCIITSDLPSSIIKRETIKKMMIFVSVLDDGELVPLGQSCGHLIYIIDEVS